MRRKPGPEDDFDAWEAEVKRLLRQCKRIHRRALMNRLWVRPNASNEASAGETHPARRLEDLWIWPRPDDPELKLNAAVSSGRRK